MASKYHDTPFGPAVYPHLNTADAKFNPDNPMFKTGIRLSGEVAQRYKERIDAAVDEAYEAFFETGDGKSLTPGERKKYTRYYPYQVEEDDDGNPTGDIVFDFKQNAIIKLRDGTRKTIAIGLYDAAGKEMKGVTIRGGSIIRANASMRPITMKSAKQVGVRLDFGRVQVKQLAEGNGGGFGAVEGYEHDDSAGPDTGFSDAGSSGEGGGDY